MKVAIVAGALLVACLGAYSEAGGQDGVIYEGCPGSGCAYGAAPADYGCPGYVAVPLAPPTGDGSKELIADKAVSLISAKCDTSSLIGGLTTDLETTLSVPTSVADHDAAERMLQELRAVGDAERRLSRFRDDWIRSGPSDADLAKQAAQSVITALLRGDFKGAEQAAGKAALAPTLLGRSDFPNWYSPADYVADRERVQRLSGLRSSIWTLVHKTNPIYRRP